MHEPTFNVFLYVSGGSIDAIGIAIHTQDGSDNQKVSFLQSQVNIDCHAAQRFQLTSPITWRQYEAMMRIGRHLEVFDHAMRCLNAPQSPIIVVTPIVDGYPSVMAITGLGPINLKELKGLAHNKGRCSTICRNTWPMALSTSLGC